MRYICAMDSRLSSVEEAARRLDVVPQRVRALIAAGRLPAQRVGKGYVLDAAEVEQFARQPRPRGRPLSAANAWALLAVLARLPDKGSFAGRPIRSQHRIESLLEQKGQVVAAALRSSQPRAVSHGWRVLPSDVDRLADDVRLVKSGLSADAKRIDVRYQRGRDGIDAYVSQEHLHELDRELQPIKSSGNVNVRLRVPEGSQWVLDEAVAPLAVVAADLLDHDDPRVARAARGALERLAQ
jgi:excisionase family DNA binding protein